MQNLPEPKVLDAALSIWRYHCLDENIPRDISTFDLIVGLGSYDTRVAERCAELYQNAISDKIVFTGAFGNWTKDHFDKTEAETFAEVAMSHGVPEDNIVLEDKATNTGENITNVKAMFPKAKTVVFVTKPQMQRRCRATVEKQWPDIKAVVTAPNHTIVSQPVGDMDLEKVVHELVGTHWRTRAYAKLGYQTKQDADELAEEAFKALVEQGYTKHLPDDWEDVLSDELSENLTENLAEDLVDELVEDLAAEELQEA